MAQSKSAVFGKGLVAVLLITRSRPGPRLVFHYPEIPKPRSKHHYNHIDIDDESDASTDDEAGDILGIAGTLESQVNSNGGDTVLGHSVESLEKLLSPGRWCEDNKFQVCLDGLTFLGHPIYAPEDGNWSPKPPTSTTAKPRYGEYHMYLDPGSVASTPPKPGQQDFTHMPDSLESQALGTSVASNSTSSGRGVEQISMFHVVFVLDSRGSEGQKEVKAVYADIAKKLSKALYYLQKQSNYVAVECRRLLAMKAKAKQQQHEEGKSLWVQMIETSELAWALKEIVEKISAGEITGLRLNGMEMSLSITQEDPKSQRLDPLAGLLLLEPKESLLRQLSHPEGSPLAHFIRDHTPTKTLIKHANNLGIPINDIMYLSHHLIKWRKAQIIAPLHQRNIYTVAEDAPLDQLPLLTEKYSKAFPTLPSLPNMIKVLSGKPIQYGHLIPSRDHRGTYMEILGFLVQHRLVVLLKTHGWLRIPKSILATARVVETDPNKRPMSVRGLLSPHLRPVEDDEVSVSSERTAIPAFGTRAHKRLSSGTQVSSRSTSTPLLPQADENVLILNPVSPSEEEAELISALTRSLDNGEMREHFREMVNFFNGETAFEEIAARIGLKRAKVEEWIDGLEGRGLLLCVKYT